MIGIDKKFMHHKHLIQVFLLVIIVIYIYMYHYQIIFNVTNSLAQKIFLFKLENIDLSRGDFVLIKNMHARFRFIGQDVKIIKQIIGIQGDYVYYIKCNSYDAPIRLINLIKLFTSYKLLNSYKLIDHTSIYLLSYYQQYQQQMIDYLQDNRLINNKYNSYHAKVRCNNHDYIIIKDTQNIFNLYLHPIVSQLMPVIKIAKDYFFVAGTSDRSLDSRYKEFGLIERKEILGYSVYEI